MRPTRPFILLALLLPTAAARAEVVALDITHREPYAGGAAFSNVGPYEVLRGVARFAIDPRSPKNTPVVDRDLAPRNDAGMVEFAADVYLLAPKDRAKGNGALLYDVNNRGKKLALGFFNKGPAGDDTGFLMRRGYTVLWSGWIGELLPGDDRLLLQAPPALGNGRPVRGMVRYEMSSDTRVKSMPLSRRDGHGSYPPTKEGEAKGMLTRRLRQEDEREVVPRSRWRLVTVPIPRLASGVPGTLPQIRLELDGGFEPGVLYELICEAEGAIVQGVSFAGVRDLVSFLRHDTSAKNPLVADGRPAIKRTHAFGVSQSGRFLRHFLYLGFNEDLDGRLVFDGLMPHVAGGGLGFFNHRFAQPTRHNGQHEDHSYPADVFPFTYGPDTDPVTKRTDLVLAPYGQAKVLPKIMHTQSAAEYWHRSGSLVHTTADGKRDAKIPGNVRVYAFGGTQHGPANDPPTKGIADNLANPADYRPFLRALLDALDAWVREGKEPPPSVYPRLADGTLVEPTQEAVGFPKLPGVRFPRVIQAPVIADYGPDFASRGIVTEPPKVRGHYKVLVPKSDRDGNDTGTLNLPDVAVPLATYTGWNLRRADVGGDGMLASLLGSYLPLPRGKAERENTGDPRPSLQERYGSFTAYVGQYGGVANVMQEQRYLLAEDVEALMHRLARRREQLKAALAGE